jgi:hypothetical protein
VSVRTEGERTGCSGWARRRVSRSHSRAADRERSTVDEEDGREANAPLSRTRACAEAEGGRSGSWGTTAVARRPGSHCIPCNGMLGDGGGQQRWAQATRKKTGRLPDTRHSSYLTSSLDRRTPDTDNKVTINTGQALLPMLARHIRTVLQQTPQPRPTHRNRPISAHSAHSRALFSSRPFSTRILTPAGSRPFCRTLPPIGTEMTPSSL